VAGLAAIATTGLFLRITAGGLPLDAGSAGPVTDSREAGLAEVPPAEHPAVPGASL
jgi:hypothetical protein